MKITTWNCQMAFRKKAERILALRPDIVVVPECEHPDKLLFNKGMPAPQDIFWHGSNRSKGIGVFSYGDYRFQLLDDHRPELRHILPLKVSGGKTDFTLFAIWANHPEDPDGQYVTQIWKALQQYDHLLKARKTLLIGDFNSNTIWDKPRREGNHSTVVARLEQQKIRSAYHAFYHEKQGQETQPTFYLYRHLDKPYHLDYCFASADFIHQLESVHVGSYEDWRPYSDHTPLTVTFKR